MSRRGVPTNDMRRLLASMEARDTVLDESTADRLLQGRLPVDDAPPAYRGVAQVIALMGAEPTGVERSGETGIVAQMTAAVRAGSAPGTPTPRRTSMSKQRIAQLAAAGSVAAMSLFGGLAAANALPGAAQSVASDMLGTLHINVPNPNTHAGTHPDGRGQSSSHPTTASPSSQDKGSTISGLARDPGTTGAEKGTTVSGAASDGKSQPTTPAGPPTSTPPVNVPNPGGTPTAGDASGGASSVGTVPAGTSSDGHSTVGSGNAANSHTP